MDLTITTREGRGGHDDLHLTAPAMELEVSADLYFFVLALEDTKKRIKPHMINGAVVSLLTYWRKSIADSDPVAILHLPFAFYDQGIGCFEIERFGDMLRVSYGHTSKEGWAVSPLNLGSFCNDVTDFQKGVEKTISVKTTDFMTVLDENIARLDKQ